MSKVFFTSDTHFSHEFVAQTRGFVSAEEHDARVVRAWNSVVSKRDTVWHLGDVGMGSIKRFRDTLDQLNGTIHLITGNHDECAPGVFRKSHNKQRQWLHHFESIQQFQRFKYQDIEFLASHFPYHGEGERHLPERYPEYRLRDIGLPLVHGHIHSLAARSLSRPREVHVGWDAWGQPVPLEWILEVVRDMQV